MTELAPKPPVAEAPQAFGRVAVRGSFLNLAQWVLNKAFTSAAILVIAFFLTPAEYGVGVQALAIFSLASVLQPLTVGDVLIAHPKRFALLAPSAAGLAMIIGCTTGVLTLLSIPIALHFYGEYPAGWLIGLLAIQALRPILEAKLMLPLSTLRLQLAYPAMAFIDGIVQMSATLLSVAMAALGGRAASIVLPQVVGAGARSIWYSRKAPTSGPARFHKKLAAFLFRSFIKAASAQYLHNVTVMLEILVLGFVSGEVETGLYGLAFTIACQANTVIAFQLGVVLQPIFGRLQDDPVRQVAGFLKTQRVLSAVCVPICFAQAILAEPLFRLVLDAKWQPAIPVFQLISLAQAFYFATGPSMSCLRAQRRFGTFLAWQAIQLALSVPIYWYGAKSSGAVGVAIASGAAWAISSPIVVWLCTRTTSSGHLRESLAIFVRPWCVCLPIFGGAYLLVRLLADWGVIGDIGSLLVVGPAAGLLAVWTMRFLHPDIRSTLDGLLASAMWRVARMRQGHANG